MKNKTANQIIEELKSYQPEFRDAFRDCVFDNTEYVKSNSYVVRLEEFIKTNPDKFNNLVEWVEQYV
jgi:flagellar biosynthesis chaperone FliJ